VTKVLYTALDGICDA